MASLKREMTSLKREMASLKREMTSLKGERMSLKRDVADLRLSRSLSEWPMMDVKSRWALSLITMLAIASETWKQ